MSQETNQFDNNENQQASNRVNIDSSATMKTPQEERQYAFNQAEVNKDSNQAVDQNGNSGACYNQTYYNNIQMNQQYGPGPQQNGGWQQPNGGWVQMPDGRWVQNPNNQPGPQQNGGWQQQPNGGWVQMPNGRWVQNPNGQPGPQQNQQWQQANEQYSSQKRETEEDRGFKNPFKSFDTQAKKVPLIKTDDDARNIYFGINQQYYNKVYREYKAGKKISWNWSAFIFRSYWFFSRKMYTLGALYTLMMSFITLGLYQVKENITNPSIVVMIFPLFLASIALWAVVGMFGNYMYMAHMENKIVYPSDKAGSAEEITKINVIRGGFSPYGILICILATNLILGIIQDIAKLL